MEQINIQTTQNIDIEYQTASIADRIYAVLIDLIVFVAYLYLAYTLVEALMNKYSQLFSIDGLDIRTVDLIIMTPVIFYYLITEISMNGQSVGKLLMQIKVANIDGTEPTVGAYFIRWLFRNLEANPILYLAGMYLFATQNLLGVLLAFSGTMAIIIMVVNGKGQRIGDILAGTTVIKLKKGMSLHEIGPVKVGRDYIPVFPQAAYLTENDVQIIGEVLKEGDGLEGRLANQLKDTLQIKTSMAPDKFLGTILKDFHHTYLKSDPGQRRTTEIFTGNNFGNQDPS